MRGLLARVPNSLASDSPQSESWAFGSSQRFYDPELERTKKLPAPDAYTVGSGLGPQNVSTKRTAPLPGFGSCTRDNTDKVRAAPQIRAARGFSGQCGGVPSIDALRPLSYRHCPSILLCSYAAAYPLPTLCFVLCGADLHVTGA